MIVYMDASALVKRYVAESGSEQVNQLVAQASAIGTSVISRAEVAAALAKAVRVGSLTRDQASAALQAFRSQWIDVTRLQLSEVLVARAGSLAWEYDLVWYDSVHLATALFWQEISGGPVVLATFDSQLWEQAQAHGLTAWPDELVPPTE